MLGQLDALVKDWVRRVSAAKGMTDPEVLAEVRQRVVINPRRERCRAAP